MERKILTDKKLKNNGYFCNRLDDGNEQDLCVPRLFSVCMVDKVQYFGLEFSFNHYK